MVREVFLYEINRYRNCKNEEEMIEDCLESLQFCDEIVVVDNESEDKTSEISKSTEQEL